MSNMTKLTLGALALALLLAGCGRGADDSLADGAVDRAKDDTGASAGDVGPPSPSSAAASPSAARTGTDAGTGTATAPGAGSPATSAPTLRVAAQGPHGPHLVDSGGIAVYMLEGDRTGDKCTGDCLQAWPPVLAGNVQPSAEAGLQGAMVSVTPRPDGSRQVTYNGHPLYRYAADGGAGQSNGHGVKDRFGTWHLVAPQGERVTHAASGAGG